MDKQGKEVQQINAKDHIKEGGGGGRRGKGEGRGRGRGATIITRTPRRTRRESQPRSREWLKKYISRKLNNTSRTKE